MSLSKAFSGMLKDAGSGLVVSGGNPWAAAGGAVLGGIFSSLEKDQPVQQLSQAQIDLRNSDAQIANGLVESPEVLEMRKQGNNMISQASGLMQRNRGASQGAKSAYISGLTAEQGARLNESAAIANANAIQNAKQRLASIGAEESKMRYANELAKADQYNNMLGSTSNLLMQGALAYNKQQDENKPTKGFSRGGSINPNAGYANMSQGNLNSGFGSNQRFGSSPYLLKSSFGLQGE